MSISNDLVWKLVKKSHAKKVTSNNTTFCTEEGNLTNLPNKSSCGYLNNKASVAVFKKRLVVMTKGEESHKPRTGPKRKALPKYATVNEIAEGAYELAVQVVSPQIARIAAARAVRLGSGGVVKSKKHMKSNRK